MHPFETAWPIDHGSFVPWIATGPPCAQPVSTGEYAEMPIAAGPYGPVVSVGDQALVHVVAAGRRRRRGRADRDRRREHAAGRAGTA